MMGPHPNNHPGFINQIRFCGHGDKSVMIASMITKLTEEEVMCIRYHMGAFTDKAEG